MNRLIYNCWFLVTLSVLGPAPELEAQELFSGRDLRTENAALHRIVDSLKRVIARFEGVLDPWDQITGIEEGESAELGYGISSLDEAHNAVNAPSWLREADPEMGLDYRDEIEGRLSGYRRRASSLGYAIGRYRYYEKSFETTFARYGVPSEFMALAIVESAVSRTAVSNAGAAGVWQLMPATARQYGLRVDDTVDERFDIAKSTDVAARVLRDLRRSLGNWGLAVMAYNCGSGNVRRAVIQNGGSTDPWTVWTLVPNETKAYLPSLVAVRYFLLYGAEEGIQAKPYRPSSGKTLKLSEDIDFAVVSLVLDIDLETLRKLNPQYIRSVVPSGMPFCVPAKYADALTKAVEEGRI